MPSVLCVGIATLDHVYGVTALPSGGAKHRAHALEVVGGGIAANAAVAVARLGGQAGLLTRLGDDMAGDMIRTELAAEGVDVTGAPPLPGHRSPISAIMVDAYGERMIVSYADSAMPALPAWLPGALPAGTGAVLGDTRWEEGALHLFRLARAAGIPAVLDADRKPADPALMQAASHIAFSEIGLTELTGCDEPKQGLAKAREMMGPAAPWLAVTMGAAGVWHSDGGEARHAPAFAVDTVDTLGAGDVWHGAFALALAEGQDEHAAIRFASAAAAIKCTRFGGRKGAPGRMELDQFLKERS